MNRARVLPALILLLASSLPLRASGRADYEEAVRWRAFVDAETRPRIGVALGGGGARGMAHVGVMRALAEAGVPVDVIAGTSIGSFIGSLCASGASIDSVEDLALKTNWSNLIELKMSRISFFSTRRLEEFIAFHLENLGRSSGREAAAPGEVTFRDLAVPFACTATDLYSGSVVVFDSGPVAAAVRASCSIPGLFEPVSVEDRLLVDGGVLVNLPVSLCRDLGASYVIGVDVESDSTRQLSGLIDILAQIIKIQGLSMTRQERERADFVVPPAVGEIKTTELQRAGEAIRRGEIAATALAPFIRRSLLSGERIPLDAPDSSAEQDLALVDRVILQVRSRGTAVHPVSGGDLSRALVAASRLGLDRDAAEIFRSLPRATTDETLLAAGLRSYLRAGRREEAGELLARLERQGPGESLRYELAAVALYARLDDLAARLVSPPTPIAAVPR